MARDEVHPFRFPADIRNLYAVEIGEPFPKCLRVTVAEGVPGAEEPLEIPLGDKTLDLGTAQPIEAGPSSRVYRFEWDHYVAYAVRNESYAAAEMGEDERDLFRIEPNSPFADYVRATTVASDKDPGPLTHWALDTLNHKIAVVSDTPPEITQLDPNERVELLVQSGWIELGGEDDEDEF
ncbi:hypothetical protein H7F51_05385 [Novosphingobium flavum]|uniref:Uncharacterized protein n=1 Tax=Novosphingobium flavum TaxID=1778672 RepID=A0A7X1FQB6_9SPHN|nr:hypothetical protein [Novosphingobium flavum]MBC2664943.1 hypothetical protein [Novosphingobium flavum]